MRKYLTCRVTRSEVATEGVVFWLVRFRRRVLLFAEGQESFTGSLQV